MIIRKQLKSSRASVKKMRHITQGKSFRKAFTDVMRTVMRNTNVSFNWKNLHKKKKLKALCLIWAWGILRVLIRTHRYDFIFSILHTGLNCYHWKLNAISFVKPIIINLKVNHSDTYRLLHFNPLWVYTERQLQKWHQYRNTFSNKCLQ